MREKGDFMSNVTDSVVRDLRNRAAMARRIANEVSLDEAVKRLRKQAQELERKAKELEQGAPLTWQATAT